MAWFRSAFLFVLAVACVGCGGASSARCPLTVWYQPSASAAAVPDALVGSWDQWARPGLRSFRSVTAADGTEWRTATIDLPPGTYQYAIVVGGAVVLDALNPRTAFVTGDGGLFGDEVSEVELADCRAPTLAAVSAAADGDALVVAADFQPGADAVGLDEGSLAAAVTRGGAAVATAVALAHASGSDGVVHVTARAPSLAAGKYTLTLTARDRRGRALSAAASAFVATANAAAAARGDALVYQVMIDRFAGPNGALAPPASPGDRAGGTLDGVRAALDAGYFDALGVTTLWLSPVYTNPTMAEPGTGGHPVVAYHGYWPDAPRTVDPLLGGDDALDALIADAHGRGVRVILDVVPNHVFADHPYYAEHSRQNVAIDPNPTATSDPGTISWFNDGPGHCVCGDPGCDWGANMETCWFASYLPDLNWRHPDVLVAAPADLAWWMTRFDLDGLRLDAVPMMPRAATRHIMHAVGSLMYRAPMDQLVVGEIYTGAGDAGRAQIRYYLGSELDGLDSAFDFPLMWSLRDNVAHGAASGFAEVEQEVAAGAVAWAGSGATIAHMIGNHDTTRFVSEANDDADGDPWSAPPPQPTAVTPYRMQLLALAFVLTLPGIPVIYYGDEVGLAGAGDPDSRRVMPDPSTLAPAQSQLLATVQQLGRARRCSPALRGSRTVALADADHDVALLQSEAGASAIVVLSRAANDATLDVPGLPAGHYRDLLSTATLVSDGTHATVTAAAQSAALYFPENDSCL